MLLCNEVVPAIRVLVLTANPIHADLACHSYVCNVFGASMKGVDW